MAEYNNKCIAYRVDPDALKQGIPIDQLQKEDVREYSCPETMQNINNWLKSTSRLLIDESHYKTTRAYRLIPVIELSNQDFLKVLSKKLVKIPSACKTGQQFCLSNKETGQRVMKTLHSVIGDYGYWH